MSLRSSIWPTATHASKESHRDGQVSTTALDFFLALASLDRKEILGYTLSLRGARTGGRGAFALAKICEMKSGELVVVKRSLKLHGPLWMFQDQEYAQYFKEFCLELRILIHDSLRSHENIINLKGIWDEDVAGVPSLSLVLEYGDHGTLDYFLQNAPRQKENQLSECISQLASGFKALHKLGICHGDVKTTNVLVVSNDSRWVCKICDFGHAVVSNTFKNESVQLPRGTAIYSAPEARDREISASFLPIITDAIFTDLYSFGLLIWEVLNKGEVYYNTIPTYDLPTPKSEFIHEFLRNLPQEKLFEYASVWIEAQDISKSPKDRLSYLVKGLLQHNPRDRLSMETVEELLSRNVSNSQTSSAVHNSNEYSTRPSSTQVSRSVQYENNSGSDSIISWSRELSLFQHLPSSACEGTVNKIRSISMRENIQKQIIAELINIADIPGLPQAVRAPAAFSVCQCLAIGFNRVHNTDDIIFWLRYAHTLGSPFATRWVFRIAQALCPDASWFSQLRNVELVEHAARGPNELYLASSIRLNDFTGWGVRPLEDQKWGFISRDTIFESCYSVKFADFFREALDGFDDFWEFELDPPESSISYSSLGFTPIHCACLGGRLSTLRLLLRVGYSATQPTIHGITPLHLCIFFAECDIEAAVHLLLENGPLPKETTFGIYWPDYDLELSGSPLRWAIRTRNLKLVKLLLPHYTDYRPDDMRCALRNYFWEILDEILLTFPSQENMWDIYVFDFEQDSFSHWIAHGSERFSSIDHTLDVVQRHNLVSVEESRNVTGNLMIMMRKAVTEEHFYHIQRLLRLMTSSQIKQDNEIQGTPLTTAITRAKHNTMWTEIFEVLLGVYTIEELYWVRIRSGENVSVLHFAIIQESVVGVRSLLAKGLNPNQCMDTPQGITPLQLCFLKRGSVELCDTLLEFGADLYMESLPIRSSPVMGLFFGDRHENARLIDHVMKMDHPEQIVLQILFTTMASISTPEDQGYALLRYLVGMPNVAKHLNAPLPEGFTLLLYSAMHGFQEVTQLLLEAGADPLTKFRFDNQDVYPLQIICAMAFQQGKLHYTHGDLKIRQIIQKQRRLASIAMLLFEWQPKAKNSPFEGIIQLHIVSYIGLEQDIQHFLEEGQDLKTPGKWPRLSAKITSHRIRMAHEGFPENKTNEEDQKIHKKLWKELRDIFDPNLSSRIEMYDLILWETRAARQALQSVQTFAKRLRRFDPNGSDIEITNGEVGSLQPLE